MLWIMLYLLFFFFSANVLEWFRFKIYYFFHVFYLIFQLSYLSRMAKRFILHAFTICIKYAMCLNIWFAFFSAVIEHDAIEEVLQNLGLESCVDLFKQHELRLELLTSFSDTELRETLQELNLPLGQQAIIIKKILEIKFGGRNIFIKPNVQCACKLVL